MPPGETTLVINHGSPGPMPRRDVDRYFEQYIDAKKHGWSPKTIELTMRNIRYFLLEHGDNPWETKYLLKTCERLFSGKQPATVALYLQSVRAFEKWMRLSGYTNSEAMSLVERPRVIAMDRKPISHEEYAALLGACDAPKLRSEIDMKYILHGLWMTGLGAADLACLQWKNWNPDTGVINFQRKKTQSKCCIPLPVGHAFRSDLEKRWPTRMQSIGSWPSTDGNHYIDNKLGALGVTSQLKHVQRRLDLHCQIAGVRKIRLHDFRGTFIAASLHHASPEVVALITGHRNPKVLLDYARPPEDKLRQVMEAANEV